MSTQVGSRRFSRVTRTVSVVVRLFLVGAVLSMLSATPAAATAAPLVFADSISFNDLNPCTGDRHRVFFDLTVTVHDFVTDDGLHHLTIHEAVNITTSSGWAGSGERQTVEVTSEDGDGTVTFVGQDQLHSPDFPGQMLRPGAVIHVTVAKGRVVADIERFRFECVGKV